MSKILELCNKYWESMHCVSQGDTCIIPLRNFWSSVRFKITWLPVLKTFIDAYRKPFFYRTNIWVHYISRITEQEQKKVSTRQVSVQLHQECTAEYASPGSPCFISFWHHCHFTPPSDLYHCFFGLTPVAGCTLQHCQECTKGIWTRFGGGVFNVNCIIYCAFTVQIDNLWCIYLSFFRYLLLLNAREV